MVDVSNYNFTSIADKTVKPEEFFINLYVDECLESDTVISSTQSICSILYAKYRRYDQNTVMAKQCQYLNTQKRYIILILLSKFEYLFFSTLGMWNTTVVGLELKNNYKPVCSKPSTVSRLNKVMFKKEEGRLVILWVIKEANDSEWGSPSFDQPKAKTNHARFLSDFRNLNRQLKHNPYPIPKIH